MDPAEQTGFPADVGRGIKLQHRGEEGIKLGRCQNIIEKGLGDARTASFLFATNKGLKQWVIMGKCQDYLLCGMMLLWEPGAQALVPRSASVFLCDLDQM